MCLYIETFALSEQGSFLHFMLVSATERRTKEGHQLTLPSVSLPHGTSRAGAINELDKTQCNKLAWNTNKQASGNSGFVVLVEL